MTADPTPTPEQPLDGLEVEPDPVYWRGFRDGREAQARPEQDEAVRLLLPWFDHPHRMKSDRPACPQCDAVEAALATPPPVPAALDVETVKRMLDEWQPHDPVPDGWRSNVVSGCYVSAPCWIHARLSHQSEDA